MRFKNNDIIVILEKFISNLKLEDYAIFIGGSFFFINKTKQERFFDGRSDVDVIVVCRKNTCLQESLEKIFPREIIEKFIRREYAILNYSYPYGDGRNILHIKFISYELFISIISLKQLTFKSFRKESLSCKKKYTQFTSNDGDSLKFIFVEEKIEFGYLLDYKFNPIQNRKLFLSDIHSLVLFSICIFDSLNVRDMRLQLLEEVKRHLSGSRIEKSNIQLFKYFYERGYIFGHWNKVLSEVFMNHKNTSLLYYQDLLK